MVKFTPLRKLCSVVAAATLALTMGTTALADTQPAVAADANYLVGTGMYDVTGAVAQTGSFGYASGQEMSGLHERLYAHAFIVVDKAANQRVAVVSIDTGAIFPNVRQAVIERLHAKYGALYTDTNVMLSATHTHVGNGGMAVDTLYRIASNDGAGYNYDQKIVDAMVNGVVAAVDRAHANLEPGTVRLQEGELAGVTRNRSLPAYEANPESSKYSTNVRTEMAQLAFNSADGEALGVLNWFSTHPTSFPINWTLVSADNKGYAQYLFEQKMGSDPQRDKTFVAAFANRAMGDVVPVAGNSVSAPGYEGTDDDYLNAEIHGKQQFDKAYELFTAGGVQLAGEVDSRMAFVKMPGRVVDADYTDGAGAQKLCVSARGFSFAPGGENGPSNIPGVYEGMTKGTFSVTDAVNKIDRSFAGAIIRMVGKVIALGDDPCQAEKPILVADGKLGWTPTTLPMQIVRIGKLVIAGVPFEPTTMASRQLEDAITAAYAGTDVTDVVVVGATNGYAGYVGTRAEFAAQHYEGASTEFGPYQLAALKQEYTRLAQAMVSGVDAASDPAPTLPNVKLFTQRPGVVFDDKPLREQFGQVLTQPAAQYSRGEVATAEFRGAHPKNNYRTMGTFLKVQRLVDGKWVDYLTDRDWDTTYHWKREGSAYSRTTVEWRIRNDVAPGTYRLVQLGDWKNGWTGKVTPYEGISNSFEVK